eukprot:4798894-Amphidinium_carterae.1
MLSLNGVTSSTEDCHQPVLATLRSSIGPMPSKNTLDSLAFALQNNICSVSRFQQHICIRIKHVKHQKMRVQKHNFECAKFTNIS